MKRTLLLLAALTLPALADQRGDTPGTQPSTPQEQLGKFHVPPGFEVQLVAAEPEIHKPINLNFDAAGRLWVSGSEMYPWPASTDVNGQPIADFDKGWRGIVEGFRVGDAPQPSANAKDSVRILSDFGPDGHARKITVFADKLNIPSGIQPLPRKQSAKGDTAIVYSIPNIWLMTDVDGDGFAEKREPLYTGFGYTDTHGGSSSYIYWIDGWIYGTHGFRNHSEVRDRNGKITVVDSGNTYRFRPDGTAFEIYAHGQTNPFGLAFDPLGNLFSADSHSKPVYMLLRGGYYEGIGKQHDGLGFAPRITDDDHGSSAIAGIAYYADDKWPEEYRGNLFNGNPVTQRINRDRLEWHGSTPKAIRMPDFLTCDDPWFRPVHLKLGPDGALYIADFYNPIIGHYEVPLTHPARDHTHGRIWRVVYRGEINAAAKTATSEEASGTAVNKAASQNGSAIAPNSINEDQTQTVFDRPKTNDDPKSKINDANRSNDHSNRTNVDSRGINDDRNRTTVDSISINDKPNSIKRPGVVVNLGQDGVSSGNPPPLLPNLATLDAADLIEKLADPSLEVRRLATNELVDRVGDEARSKIARRIYHPPTAQEALANANDPLTDLTNFVYVLPALERLKPGIDVTKEAELRLPETEFLADIWCGNGATPAESLRISLMRVRLFGEAARTKRIWRLAELAASAENARMSLLARRSAVEELASGVEELLNPQPASSVQRVLTSEFRWETAEEKEVRIATATKEAIERVPECLAPLLRCWTSAPIEDVALIYGVRMALRNCLLVAETYGKAQRIALGDPAAAERLADVSLGVKNIDSADFLLSHLERTKFETPRAGEYLKHAVLYLPAEKLDAVVKLVGQVGNAPLPRKLALATNLAEAARQRGIALPSELTAWSQGVILETLASNNDELTKPAIAALRDVKLEAKLAPLAKIARDEFRDDALRLAALEAAANLPASRELLDATFAGPRHLILRRRAAELLAQSGDTATILAALPQAESELALAIAAALAKSDDGAAALLDAIEAGKAPVRLLVNKAVAGSFFSRPKALQDRAKVLAKDVPPEDTRLDKVIATRAAAFRDSPREVTALEKGAQVFQQNCAVCHRFHNVGGNVGPNLDGVVARGPQRLIEDILDPNRNVDPGFRQTIIETRNGQMLAGTNVREQPDAVLLTDATGKELNIPKSEIKTRTQTQLSLMPPAFETTLAPADFNNLLVYLLSAGK